MLGYDLTPTQGSSCDGCYCCVNSNLSSLSQSQLLGLLEDLIQRHSPPPPVAPLGYCVNMAGTNEC